MSRLIMVFDMDDTLYPERDFALAGFAAAGRWAETALGIQGLGTDMTRLLDEGHLGRVFPTALSARMPDHTDEHVKQLHQAYRTAEPRLTLHGDARFALDHYGAKGPLGLITDGTLAVQQKKLAGLDVADRFAHVVFTDALGEGRQFFKPHPRAFELTAAALGRPGDRFAYIGDNPVKDFVAPNAMGWTTVQVLRERSIHDQSRRVDGGEPHHIVRSLRELPAVLGV